MTETAGHPALETIAQLLAARTGLVTSRTPDDFERATLRAMKKLNLDMPSEFAALLSADTGWDELLDEVTIGETYFFRNPEHFEFVRDTIIPNILRQRVREPNREQGLRVWSAGCASGEEPYSLAIMLHEAGLLEASRVYGTDICALAIAKARAGHYRDWAFRQIDSGFAERYFRRERSERVLIDSIREQVTFRQLNLASDSYPSPLTDTCEMDIIFCRNVLIYLSPEAIANVERRLFESLAPGGWLVAGPSDPMLGQVAPFEVNTNSRAICYRRPAHERSAWFAGDPVTPLHVLPSFSEPIALAPLPTVVLARPANLQVPAQALSRHDQAHAAFARADYPRVIEIARMHPEDHQLTVLHVRAAWNHSDSASAQRVCAEAIAQHGMSPELHYLHAVTLFDCRKLPQARSAVQKALYLDRTLSIAHFTLGSILERMHDFEGAHRAYRNAYETAIARAPDELLHLGDGIAAAGMAASAAQAMNALKGKGAA